jgi:transcriptional regulator with XRE-family HTH domain
MAAQILNFVAMQQLPNRIREIRKAQGATLEQVAEKVGCSIPQVSDLERGEIQLTLHWMRKIATALAVEPADLLLREDNSGVLSIEERQLVERLRQATDDQREQLLRVIDAIMPATRAESRKSRSAA